MTITVFHNGTALLVNDLVAEQLSLHRGQNIPEATMWRCIELNAAAMLAEMDVRNLTAAEPVDVSGLRAELSKGAAQPLEAAEGND